MLTRIEFENVEVGGESVSHWHPTELCNYLLHEMLQELKRSTQHVDIAEAEELIKEREIQEEKETLEALQAKKQELEMKLTELKEQENGKPTTSPKRGRPVESTTGSNGSDSQGVDPVVPKVQAKSPRKRTTRRRPEGT